MLETQLKGVWLEAEALSCQELTACGTTPSILGHCLSTWSNSFSSSAVCRGTLPFKTFRKNASVTRQVLENTHMIPSLLNFFFKNLTFPKLIQPTHSSPSPTPSPLPNILSMPLRELIFAWFPPSAHIMGWDYIYGSEERLLIQGEFGPQTSNITIILDLGPIPHLWNQRPWGKRPASCVKKKPSWSWWGPLP